MQSLRDQVGAKNNLAWLLATHPDPKLRDGTEALRLVRELIDAGGNLNPNLLDTLAAAQAETGNHQQALATATRAVELALAANATALAYQIKSSLPDYQRGEPFREDPASRP